MHCCASIHNVYLRLRIGGSGLVYLYPPGSAGEATPDVHTHARADVKMASLASMQEYLMNEYSCNNSLHN